MSWFFTTAWGLGYLVVMVLSMLPAFFLRPERRWLAMGIVGLWICDRAAVHALAPDLALFFLAFAYLLVALAVVATYRGLVSRVVAAALSITSMAFIIGGFGLIDWDITGAIQELSGVVAMATILFFGDHHGSRRPAHVDDRSVRGELGVPSGSHSRRADHK
jgi:hypothetical protein